MQIRKAHPHEHADLGEVCVRAYRGLGSVSDSYAANLRDVAGRAQTTCVLAAVDRTGPLGCVTVILDESPWREISGPGEGEFRMLAVDAGRERVVISSAGDMAAAHRLYERLGFTRAPARDWSPVPDVELRVYELTL
jgi:hypothetical protein